MKNIANIITKAFLLIYMMVSTTMVLAEGEEPGGDPTPTGITTADQLKTALTAANSSDPITVTLAGYMGMVDAVLNTPGDNECIGLLICQSKNNVFAQYALSKLNAPIGVAEYELQRYLPTTEELEQRLNNLTTN